MKKWECPDCGEENSHQMTLCTCGYRDVPMAEIEASPVARAPQLESIGTSSSVKTEKKQQKAWKTESREEYFKRVFSPSYWRHRYTRWMKIAIGVVFFLRKTTDGLLFIAFVAHAIAKRFEERKKHGTPLIYGKKKNESIWQYGVGRTLTALILPGLLKKALVNKHKNTDIRFLLRVFFIMCALHLYIGVIGIFDAFAPERVADLLSILNKPVAHLLPHWPAYQICAEKFISHGYAYRLPLLSHVYIVWTIGSLFCVWFVILSDWNVGIKSVFNRVNEVIANDGPKGNNITKKGLSAVFRWAPTRLMIASLMIWGLILFFKHVVQLPLHFPGEPLPRYGKYVWMYSYAYVDNIGFLTPIYFFIPQAVMLYLAVLMAVEALYRTVLNVKLFFMKLLR